MSNRAKSPEGIQALPGSYLARLRDEKISGEERIARLFERFLVRRPTQEELAMAKQVAAGNSRKSWEDMQWLLVNKVEFLHNF